MEAIVFEDMNELAKTGHIFIAGASSDIGIAIAKALDQKGEKLILHASLQAGIDKLHQQFGQSEGHHFIKADFSELARLNEKFSNLFLLHPLKGMVNCVGIRSRRPLKLLKPAHVQEIFQVNFFAFLELLRVACQKKRYTEGFSVVQISSISAAAGGASVTAYAASKAAADVAVRSLAKELYPKGIRLNSIRCGQVESAAYRELQAGKESDPVLDRQYVGLLPAEEVVHLALFLLSSKASTSTGQFFNADGGFLQ